ncbi:hypothetical protein Pcinc_017776 [Petrolisthes cinctipes]|uniref:Uncharacterized protein n=1 Tax=Petrolisthes cinctipes TaxID=88211 RepID=A0AAE1FNK0_PETCI|nr:hypothetical protein Pcinc_017776 [Petrolisthes cinctipes]
MTDQVDSNTQRLEALEKKLEAQQKNTESEVNRAISEVNNAIEREKDKIKSEVRDDIVGVLQDHEKTGVGGTVKKEQVKVEVQEALEDEKDKAFRAGNLIIAGVPEPDTDDMDAGNSADLASVTRLFTDGMKLDPDSYRITNTTRLYRGRKEPADTNKDRLLRVRFDSSDMVGKVARASPELENAANSWMKNTRIFRDRSKKERDERRELIREAHTKNNEEEDSDYKWYVDFSNKKVLRKKEGEERPRPFRTQKYR